MRHLVTVVTLLQLGMLAYDSHAALVGAKSSSDFDYKYEMDAKLGTLDLDSNSTSDWFNGTSGGLTQPDVAGGIGISDQSANEILWRTDIGGSLSRATVTGEFTLELSLKLNGTAGSGSSGIFGVALEQPGQGQSLRLNIGSNEVNFNNAGTGAISTGDNTDGFHTFRIAFADFDNDEYFVWRDDILLNNDLSSPFVGSNSSFNAGGSWFVGDFSSTLAGEWEVDYLRVTSGAYTPAAIPEASALLFSGLVAGVLGLRQLRRLRAR